MVMSLDAWREFIKGSNSDIFDIIKQAIKVASLDSPEEFKSRRDGITELIFRCSTSGAELCQNCKTLELEGGRCKNVKQVSNGEVKAMTAELEEESQYLSDVLRIKTILDNYEEETVSSLLDSLKRLQLMDLSINTLKETKVGKSVNALKKHSSKEIRTLARGLLEIWIARMDEYLAQKSHEKELHMSKPNEEEDPYLPPLNEEVGLAMPPMDEGFLSGRQNISMDLSQIFDDIDEDGNTSNKSYITKTYQNRPGKPSPEHIRRLIDESLNPAKKDKKPMRKEAFIKPNRPSIGTSDSKPVMRPKAMEQALIKKQWTSTQETLKSPEEVNLEDATKRMKQRYKEAHIEKKRRMIKVVELKDIPTPPTVSRFTKRFKPNRTR